MNLIDPSGFTWTSNWKFFWDWALGTGDRNFRSYGPATLESQEMMRSPSAQKLRDAFYRNRCRTLTHQGYGTVEAYRDTIANPRTADWSSTAAQVGGFAGASVLNNGNGTVTFVIPNTAGTHSFFLHLVPDIASPTGPMHNIDQVFQWSEPINQEKCKCALSK